MHSKGNWLPDAVTQSNNSRVTLIVKTLIPANYQGFPDGTGVAEEDAAAHQKPVTEAETTRGREGEKNK
jgi:hypothetical protein